MTALHLTDLLPLSSVPPDAVPRLVVAGLSGGGGKTIVSLGLAGAFRRLGLAIQPFKKGPDYIDAAWLGLAAGVAPVNLDPFLMPPTLLAPLFAERIASAAKNQPADLGRLALIEGNRGLFDGKDVKGSCSSAEVARLLDAPVLLVVDATKMTRTVAAIVQGCRNFEPTLRLAGIILNRTAGERHRAMLAECLAAYTDLPLLGMLPKIAPNPIPEQYMGLTFDYAHASDMAIAILRRLADVASTYLDLPKIWQAAIAAGPLPSIQANLQLWPDLIVETTVDQPRIGYVRDAALWFYYEESLEALRRAGAELVEVSLLNDMVWPTLDGLYLGGGFPESQAETLAENIAIRKHLARLSTAGLPIYAECGGFMILAETLVARDREYPMAGIFPVATEICAQPQGLGYVEARVVAEVPFFSLGARLYGHEFHYSRCLARNNATSLTFSLTLDRGTGILDHRDGLISRNTFATYTHLHALGVPEWAGRFIRAALAWKAIATA